MSKAKRVKNIQVRRPADSMPSGKTCGDKPMTLAEAMRELSLTKQQRDGLIEQVELLRRERDRKNHQIRDLLDQLDQSSAVINISF